MDKKLRDIIKYAVSAAVAVVLLWLCFRKISWAEALEALRTCSWGWVVVSMVLGAAVFLIRALRWKMLLDPLDPSVRTVRVLNGINIGYLVSIALSRLGELVRCGVVSRHSAVGEDGRRKASFDKVFGTVVLDRVWDALVSLLLVGGVIALMWGRYDSLVSEIFSSGSLDTALLWLLGGLGVAAAGYLAVSWLLRERSGFFRAQWGIVRRVFDGLGTCLRMERSWRFFLYTAAIWALYVLMVSCIGAAFPGLGLDGWDCLFLMAVGSIASIIPVPGGFGAYHWVVGVSVAAIAGIPLSGGIVFATVSHESQIVTQLLCGTASYISESISKD